MFEVSDLAISKVKEYLSENNIASAVRVAIMSGGCSGPALSLALDEKKRQIRSTNMKACGFWWMVP